MKLILAIAANTFRSFIRRSELKKRICQIRKFRLSSRTCLKGRRGTSREAASLMQSRNAVHGLGTDSITPPVIQAFNKVPLSHAFGCAFGMTM